MQHSNLDLPRWLLLTEWVRGIDVSHALIQVAGCQPSISQVAVDGDAIHHDAKQEGVLAIDVGEEAAGGGEGVVVHVPTRA
jgi:hypothetical protein